MLLNMFKKIIYLIVIFMIASCGNPRFPKELHFSSLDSETSLQEFLNSENIKDGDVIILDDNSYTLDSIIINKSIRLKSNKITSINSNIIIGDDLQVFLENLYINKELKDKGNLINNGALVYLKNVKVEGEIINLGHIVDKSIH